MNWTWACRDCVQRRKRRRQRSHSKTSTSIYRGSTRFSSWCTRPASWEEIPISAPGGSTKHLPAEFAARPHRGATAAAPCSVPSRWRENAAAAAPTKTSSPSADRGLFSFEKWNYTDCLRRMWLINASAYRSIGRYRRAKHRKSVTSFKLIADTPLRPIFLTLTINY